MSLLHLYRSWVRVLVVGALLLGARPCLAQNARTAVINDSDGFSNVRAAPSKQARVIAQIPENERFTVFPTEGTWWRVRTADGREGFISSTVVRLLEVSAAAPTESSTAAAAVANTAASFRTPPSDASPNEKFLYELALVARRYRLDMAYRARRSHDELDDSAWTRTRMKRVGELLQSPLGAAVSEPLREYCRAALLQDGILHVITDFAFGNEDKGKSEALDIARGLVKGIPDDRDGSNGGRALGEVFGLAGRIYVRQQARQQFINEFAALKRRENLHRRWTDVLRGLSAEDASLQPYAARPADTDMAWHYMSNRLAGDMQPGQSVMSDRIDLTQNPRLTFIRRSLGDLSNGPIRVRVRQRGAYTYLAALTGASGKIVFVARSSRGHVGIMNILRDSAWAAGEMLDDRDAGRLIFTDAPFDRPGEMNVVISHLPLSNDDLDVDGTVLIYPSNRFRSDADANTVAREVDLR